MISSPPTWRRTILLGATGGAAILIGAVLWQGRGPDPAYLPQMVTYQMPDGRALQVQVHEVTLDEWNRCHDAGGCALRLRPPTGRDMGDYPATGLSWVDAQEYLDWVTQQSGHDFRLPTLAEWTAMAAPVMPETPDPIFTDPNLTWASAYLTIGTGSRRLEPSGSYSVTDAGIADLDGNVWEWTQSCYDTDGVSLSSERCPAFYAMGEHEAVMSYLIRDPARGGCAMGAPPAHLGLRLVTDKPLPVG